jgi:uncharacterized protein YraI
LNHCYRAKPATPVKLGYQGTCCLTAAHSECRVYQKDPGFPLPPDLRNRQHGSAQRKRSKVRLWVILFVLVIIGLMVWQGLSNGLFRFAGWEHTAGETVPILLTETGVLTPPVVPTLVQDTSTPTFLPPSPSPTWTVATSTPTAAMVTPKTEKVNCRFGPGTSYPVISELRVGVIVPILGSNADHSWWQIDDPLGSGSLCWVSDAVVNTSGDLSGVPVITAPPLPPTGSPTNTPLPTTFTSVPTNTPVPSNTPIPPSDTPAVTPASP